MRSWLTRGFSCHTLLKFLVLAAAVLAAHSSSRAESATNHLGAGDGEFEFSGWQGPALHVFLHVPQAMSATTPVVFVMHGRGRDADRYRDEWSALAETNAFILVVPKFDAKRFPGSASYNHGRFRDATGNVRPRPEWAFSAIEPLFDEIKSRTATRVATYAIYGHSAGAQFVHRFALFMPEARFHAAVTANAGSYAMPVFDVDFPYGLRGAPVDESTLARAMSKPMVVLLGTADVDPNHKSLPHDPAAMAQGPHRRARGEAFYERARTTAEKLGVPFNWRVRYAEGIAHSNGGMAAFAAPFLGARASAE